MEIKSILIFRFFYSLFNFQHLNKFIFSIILISNGTYILWESDENVKMCFSSHLSKEDRDKLSVFRPSFFEISTTTLDVGCHSCIAVLQRFMTNC